MLKIFNDLKPFFEDCYRELGVREYSRIMEITAPTASKILKDLEKEGLLKKKEERGFLLFRASRNNLFKDISIAYWRNKLSYLFKNIHKEVLFKQIILFGSIAKSENNIRSDIDIFIDTFKRNIDVKSIEKKLKRKVQLHFKEETKNVNLLKNIENGVVIL